MSTRRLTIALVAALATSSSANAAGLFLTPRGVRPLARGGAFVAGAQSVSALGYNPAGIAEGSESVLLDMVFPLYDTQFTRSITEPNSGVRTVQPTVNGESLFAPIPTMGFVHGFGLVDGLRFGGGILADVPALQNWPEELDDGTPAPQRYAIIDYRGTLIAKASVGLAYQIGDWVTVGATFQLLFGTFVATSVISNCDGVICTLPENPDFDATVQLAANDISVPGGHFGIIAKPLDWLRLGLSWETGYDVQTEGDVRIRLPSSPLFDSATVDPDPPRADVALRLPMQLRAGIEGRILDWARIEVAFAWEQWSVHERISIDASGTTLRNVVALGDYSLRELDIERGFRDTWSVRVGTELTPPIADEHPLSVRAGLVYEPSAAPDDKLTPLVVDLDQLIISTGLAWDFGSVAVEATYAYVHLFERVIETSTVKQTNPIRPRFPGVTSVGEGTYRGTGHVIGAGIRMEFE